MTKTWGNRFFPNSTQVADMIEACTTCLGYVFSEIRAVTMVTVRDYTPMFLADADELVSSPRTWHGKLVKNLFC